MLWPSVVDSQTMKLYCYSLEVTIQEISSVHGDDVEDLTSVEVGYENQASLDRLGMEMIQ